ncbi:hypothetical protein [Vibrio harveyi]|uniref:hypothetical protein n=1 Tax=Vibrio harveyi TaxID=669 RepID=UPI0018F20366|nr:hypothetical protein [Vibrio harveyi]
MKKSIIALALALTAGSALAASNTHHKYNIEGTCATHVDVHTATVSFNDTDRDYTHIKHTNNMTDNITWTATFTSTDMGEKLDDMLVKAYIDNDSYLSHEVLFEDVTVADFQSNGVVIPMTDPNLEGGFEAYVRFAVYTKESAENFKAMSGQVDVAHTFTCS